MGLKRTDEFRQDAVRIALTSGLTRKQVRPSSRSTKDVKIRYLKFLKSSVSKNWLSRSTFDRALLLSALNLATSVVVGMAIPPLTSTEKISCWSGNDQGSRVRPGELQSRPRVHLPWHHPAPTLPLHECRPKPSRSPRGQDLDIHPDQRRVPRSSPCRSLGGRSGPRRALRCSRD